MALDDRTTARLAEIGRRLAREEPELAEAMHRWRAPVRRQAHGWSWRILLVGLALGVLALVLGSIGWSLLLALVTGCGWCVARGLESESQRPSR